MTSNTIIWRLTSSIAAIALAAMNSGPGLAQEMVLEANQNNPLDQEATAITVTGSRIQSSGMQAPVPVTAVSAGALEVLSPGPLVSAVSQLPQFYGNQTPTSQTTTNGAFFSRSGYGTLNLRGLGVNRTLTLLNGRRMPSVSAFGGVDITLFPEAMIASVETTTGGASAAYGSDAVAGVVNFVLDTDFTGVELKSQFGITERGDGENVELNGAFGTKIGDRGHLLLSADYYSHAGISDFSGRQWYQAWGTLGSGTTTSPYRFSENVISSAVSFDGIISSPNSAINGLTFDRSGNLVSFNRGSTTQGNVGVPGARHVGGEGISGDDLRAEAFNVHPEFDRYSFFAYGDYELTDNIRIFAQFLHGRTHVFEYNKPRGSFGGTPTTLTIFQDNAFLPESLRATMVDNDIASFTLRRMGSLEDVGQMYIEDTTTQNIGTAGFETKLATGGFLDGWSVDGFYQYGHSKRDWRQLGLRVDRVFAAVDAVKDSSGNVVCRVSTFSGGADAFPGCQPLNLFGRGNASAAAVDYVVGIDPGQSITTPIYFADSGFALGVEDSYVTDETKNNLTTFEQHFAELSAAGDVANGWAGPISMALGASWRRDSIRQLVRDATNPASNHDGFRPVRCNDPAIGLRGVSGPDCANTIGNQYSKVSNINGSAEVWEAFAEVLVPLVDTDAFTATANAAGRWADYSGSGQIWAYKGGLEVGFLNQLRLRGTYSRDVRAANLSERFDKTGGSATIIDPRYPQDGNVTVTRFSGGNPAVKPEEADTITLGAVFQPDFLPGFSASLDWYKIDIKGAISQVGNQAVVDRCELEGAAEFCALVVRDLVSDRIVLIGDVFVNVAQAVVSGVDLEVSYRSEPGVFAGRDRLTARLFASWLTERSETNSSGITTDYRGQTGARQSDAVYFAYPNFKATASLAWDYDDFSAQLQGRYIGEGVQDATLTEGSTIVDNSVDAVMYVDLRLSYKFDIGGADLEFFGSATNMFDVSPPLTPSYSAFYGYSTQYNPAVYDILGRRFTFGAKLNF